ncbi:cwf18 pre-mRNA splicing factor-domain-containing protein [Rhodotorula diobovata]|uniref:Cwf18 pre-mRNA splicing factor-domain-containing protein n=1 Tax=Rhodotorula diobovata TaxID=5288 RepID=A0A5C5FZW1_9BASI|nr:cwf18 pre-mRNA splicing factor-domain-containing protein [Rhodotorula diobovata]
MSLQEAAEARKAKLAALKKRKAAALSGSESQDQGTAADEANDTEAFKFRNYDPETGKARKHARTDEADTVEKQVEGLADQAIAQDEAHRAQELDLTNIQPKKPNWDLKRDLDRKLSKLRPKTDMAISQLIRKRLQAQRGTATEPATDELLAGMDKAGAAGADDEASDEE